MAVLSFTCLLRVGEEAPIRRGGSCARALGFHTVKFHTSSAGSGEATAGRGYDGWNREGSTLAVQLAHFCLEGAADLQMVMAISLSGCASAHAQWHGWRRGASAALSWLGLPMIWLVGGDRWMSELVAAHYGDARDDFIVAYKVELPWPSAQGGMEWEWRLVSLKDMFPGELLAHCVRVKDVGREEVLGGWRDAEAAAESSADRGRREDGGGGGGDSQPTGGGGPGRRGEIPVRSGDASVLDVPLAFAAVQGPLGSECAGGRREREDVIDVDAEPPPPPAHRQAPRPSVGSGSRHTGRVQSRRSWERGRQQDRSGLWVRPSSSFPPSRQWVRGLGSACGVVSGMRGCVTSVQAGLRPRWVRCSCA